jgi:hypothetical protein
VVDEVQWKEVATKIHAIGVRDGWLPSDSKLVSYNKEQLAALSPGMERILLYLWGSNSRARSDRIRKLGWEPRGPTFWESLEEDVAKALPNSKK